MQQFRNQLISEVSAYLTPSAHEHLILPAACVLTLTLLLSLAHFLRSRNCCLSTPSHMPSQIKMVQTILEVSHIICFIYIYSLVISFAFLEKGLKVPMSFVVLYDCCYEWHLRTLILVLLAVPELQYHQGWFMFFSSLFIIPRGVAMLILLCKSSRALQLTLLTLLKPTLGTFVVILRSENFYKPGNILWVCLLCDPLVTPLPVCFPM